AGGHSAVKGLRSLALTKRLPAFATGGPVSWSDQTTFTTAGIPDVVNADVAVIRHLAERAEVPAGPGGGPERRRGVGLQALGIAGQSSTNIGRLLMQMGTESGGDPKAINRWDINWQQGHPSVGLMQVIKGTYEAYHHPNYNAGPFEYGVSEDPLANIL